MKINLPVTQNEILLQEEQKIVTQTDVKGIIRYVNPGFIEISGYSEQELLGASHNIVRHPDMPPQVFKSLWQTLSVGRPWHGIIKNRSKNGDFYWVEANISPLYQGEDLTGYLSVRYKPRREQIEQAEQQYHLLAGQPDLPLRPAGLSRLIASLDTLMGSRTVWWFLLHGSLGLGVLGAWLQSLPVVLGMTAFTLLLIHQRQRQFNPHLTIQAIQALQAMAQGDFKYRIELGHDSEAGRLLESIKSVQVRQGFTLAETTRIAEELLAKAAAHAQAEAQLQEQRWFTHQLEKTLNEFALVSVTDTHGNITYANEKFCEVSGFSRNELLGQNHRIINSGHHDAEFFRDLWATIRRNETWRGEVCNKRKQGDCYWVDAIIRPIGKSGHDTEFYISVRREITDEVLNRQLLSEGKLQAEHSLREKQNILTTILDNIGSAVYMKSPDSGYLYANPQYVQLYGLDSAVPVDTTDPKSLPSGEWSKLTESDQQVFTDGKKIEGMVSISSPDETEGERHYWEVKIPLKREDGNIYALLGIATDITERQRLEDERILLEKKSIQLKTGFMANISHEIRTPMNSVLSVTELLRDDILSREQSHYLDILQFSCQHVLCLINDMLELSRIEAGNWKMDKTSFSLSDVLDRVISGLQPLAHNKGLSLELELSGDIPDIVVGCPLRLGQIITNLVGNAIKFTAQGGVRVIVQPIATEDDVADADAGLATSVRFAVQDSGIGIDPAHQERIFKAFEQVYDPNVEGTGLGLTISASLVYLMGGRLRVDSAPGKGSCFYFDLLLPLGDKDEYQQLRQQNPVVDLTGKRVLLVEDNHINRELAKTRLQKLGCLVLTAEHGQMALDLLEQESCDLILMDMRMPVMDGLTATHLYRQREIETARPRTPIIALTANAHDEDIRVCREAGMDGHISKPFTIEMLIQGITAAMANIEFPSTQQAALDNPLHSQLLSPVDFDYASALNQMDGDQVLLHGIMTHFLDAYSESLDNLHQALRERDASTGRNIAHTLKGNTGYLAASSLYQQASHLENLFRDGQLEAASLAMAEFEETGNRLIAALRQHLS